MSDYLSIDTALKIYLIILLQQIQISHICACG